MKYFESFHRIGKDGKKYYGKSAAGILFTDGQKVLLLKRAIRGDNFEKWSVPGGKLESKETPIDGARRESQEECGHSEGQMFGHYDDLDGRFHFHTFFFAVSKPFEIKTSSEHSEGKWVELENVPKMNLHPRFAQNWPYFLEKIKKRFPKIKSFSEWIDEKSNFP